MGSGFFRNRELGPAVGSNSTIGRSAQNDPVSTFLFGKPASYTPTAGPYAGMAPTLAASQRGYATQPNGQAGNVATPGNSAQLQAVFGPKGGY